MRVGSLYGNEWIDLLLEEPSTDIDSIVTLCPQRQDAGVMYRISSGKVWLWRNVELRVL